MGLVTFACLIYFFFLSGEQRFNTHGPFHDAEEAILALRDGHDLLLAPGYSWQEAVISCSLDSSCSFSLVCFLFPQSSEVTAFLGEIFLYL